MNLSDRKLIADYLAGDEKSLEILIKRHLKPVYGFVFRRAGNKQEAEDITQEVFLRVWRNLKKFDCQRSFRAWIFSIARNAVIDALRKKKTLPFAKFAGQEGKNVFLETLADTGPSPADFLERKDVAKKLFSAINKLLPRYSEVLFLRYQKQFTFREIAEALGEPLNTVKSRHRRALILLKGNYLCHSRA